MRILIICFLCFPFGLSAQFWFEVYPYTVVYDFEDTTNFSYLSFDINSSGNIWEVGLPEKVDFGMDINLPNVIVTDRLLPYPVNDTSSFTIKIPLPIDATDFFITGNFYSDTDSLNDYGKIEYSFDNGESWVLISDDTLTYTNWQGNPSFFPRTGWGSDLPVLTGNSNGWQTFFIDLIDSYYIFDQSDNGSWDDTAFYRFTFISDSISENRDGLMFDNIQIVNIFAFGLDEVNNQQRVFYPNPVVSDQIYFEIENVNSAKIYDLRGNIVKSELGQNIETLHLHDIRDGMYFLVIENDNGLSYSKKLIKL